MPAYKIIYNFIDLYGSYIKNPLLPLWVVCILLSLRFSTKVLEV